MKQPGATVGGMTGRIKDMDRWLGDGGMELIGTVGGSFEDYGVDGEDLGWVTGSLVPTPVAGNPHGVVQAGVHGLVLDAADQFWQDWVVGYDFERQITLAARMQSLVCGGMAMLKITNSATVNEDRWTLCGQLAGLGVAELRSNWAEARDQSLGRRRVIDLSDVTLIDESGEELLGELRGEGAELVATGVYTKHLLENLKSNEKRPFRT